VQERAPRVKRKQKRPSSFNREVFDFWPLANSEKRIMTFFPVDDLTFARIHGQNLAIDFNVFDELDGCGHPATLLGSENPHHRLHG
jgi:hypothetical protein